MYISEIEEIEELTGYIEGCGNSGGSEPPPTIMGGYHLNTVNIRTLTISDLINTSTIDSLTGTHTATVTCSATGGTGSYTYEVYVEGEGYADGGQEIAVSDNTAVITLQSGYYKIRVTVTDSAGFKSTLYFVAEY